MSVNVSDEFVEHGCSKSVFMRGKVKKTRCVPHGSASKASWDCKGDWDLLIITRNKLSCCENWAHAKAIRIELARSDIACDILIISRNEQIEAEKLFHSIARSAIHEGIKIA